jgi:hypothetical protein
VTDDELKALVASNAQAIGELQQRYVETDRQYRGMVQAMAAMADAHREFMQRTDDRLNRIEKIVESNAKSIQALSAGG